jgi:amidase
MSFTEYADYDGMGLAELVRDKEIEASELVEEAIARIERHDETLNAVVHKGFEIGRQAAKAVDEGKQGGPFAGVPFLLKDIGAICEGLTVQFGSRFLAGFAPPVDDELVRRYKAAGTCILGVTNAPEFGLLPFTEPLAYGPCHNPWDPAHSTGGSSGGAAAAVAAGIVPMAHANDGGGSIRIPASCCGLVGMKPTRARISQGPYVGEALGGLVNHHVVSRTVRDSAAMLDATAGPMPGDPQMAPLPEGSFLAAAMKPPESLRIAFRRTDLEDKAIDPEVASAVCSTAELLRDLGHQVEEASPEGLSEEAFAGPFQVLWSAGAVTQIDLFARLTGKPIDWDLFEPATRAFYEDGQRYSAADYIAAWDTLQGLGRQLGRFFEGYDVLLMPTLASAPAKLGTFDVRRTDIDGLYAELTRYVPYTPLFNGTGQPAISLPLQQSSSGLPLGMMFVGRFGAEELLYSLASQLEEALPWKERRPLVWG